MAEKLSGLIENPMAGDVFATGAIGFSIVSGTAVSITLASTRWNPVSEGFQHVVIGQLVMPVAGAQSLAIALNDFLSKQGLDPSQAASAGEKPN